MKFSGLTTASARLRAQAHRQELEKEAMLGALVRGGLAIGRKAIGGVAKGVGRAATAPVRAPARGMLNYAKKKPLQAAFGALAVTDAAGQARKAGKGYRAAQQGVQYQGQMSEAMRRARRMSPAHDIAPMSGF